MTAPLHIAGPEAFAEVFGVSRETIEKLETYEALLKQWQKAMNLVAPSTLGDVWHRHFADSAQLLRWAPKGAERWLDLGSGGGFPSLVVAILSGEKGGCRFTLVESDSRKAAFLSEVVRRTGAPVDIMGTRIETYSTQTKVLKADVIAARALAPLERLLALSRPFFAPRTRALFLKGKEAESEIAQAERVWRFSCRREASVTDRQGRVLIVEDLKSCSEG